MHCNASIHPFLPAAPIYTDNSRLCWQIWFFTPPRDFSRNVPDPANAAHYLERFPYSQICTGELSIRSHFYFRKDRITFPLYIAVTTFIKGRSFIKFWGMSEVALRTFFLCDLFFVTEVLARGGARNFPTGG